ncbi:MAG: glycerol-3-phosphate dehydrogenase [Candidatus Cloacimonetes bacterium 4572_55]|nr:MAG: glycerol-3-phosphate dehydrogenase [Candidatus Cloacimonetes bacterium 4572_55]
MANITVLGSGSWGCTLAIVALRNRHRVRVWGFFQEEIDRINADRRAEDYLPGTRIPEEIYFTSNMEDALDDPDMIMVVVPSHVVRPVVRDLARFLRGTPGSSVILNAAKGIENDTLFRMSEVIKQELPDRFHDQVCTLSGPSLAREVCARIPTLVAVAGKNQKILDQAQSLLMSERFRIYTNSDIIGVELGGSLKNVIAIASGALDGLRFGDNTKGALMTRGLAEMTRLGTALGADPATFSGLAGMGDLITTCASKQSRNRYVGERLGQGEKLKDILSQMVMVAEGVKTTESAYRLAKKTGVEMPIVEQVYAILFQEKDILQATSDLMLREAKSEIWQ